MDLQLFRYKLLELIEECGGRAAAPPRVTLRGPKVEHFIENGGRVGSGLYDAQRAIQPFEIEVSITAERIGEWCHVSDDDRRLHPSLRSAST